MNAVYKKGFTLIEVLIALFIFAIIAVIVTGILYTVFNARDATRKNAERLSELQIAVTLLRSDLTQIAPRAITDANGKLVAPIIGEQHDIKFTRQGYLNPFGMLKRSNLQRVSYFIKNHQLIRETWPTLDRTLANTPDTKVVLNHVSRFNLSYLGNDKQFATVWPAANIKMLSNGLYKANTTPIPKAIKINLSINNWGAFSLLIKVPSANIQ